MDGVIVLAEHRGTDFLGAQVGQTMRITSELLSLTPVRWQVSMISRRCLQLMVWFAE